jgi:hypothetical protein
MKILLLIFLLGIFALVSVGMLRRRREHRRAERAKALRAERLKARKRAVPHVSANLYGSNGPEHPSPMQRPPPSRAA